MRLTYFGGPAWDAGPLPARGRGQESLLFRLAVDAGAAVSVRALADDLWPVDAPDDPRAAVQSLVSRLRRALGSATIEGREASGEKVIANIRAWCDGHRPPDQVLEGWA